MAARASVPILLLTGFLGGGKTSLLAQWLRAPEFAGAMAIVNELGEVGLDDRLVQTSSEAPLLLDNGCACCAGSEDLAATLERLFWDRLHRRIPPFSWVLIETTGVADPRPILDLIGRPGLVSERYHVEGVVTTFDARRGPAQLERHPECRSQIETARAVVITKTDIASAAELAAARAAVARLRADVPVLESSRADLSAAVLMAALADRQTSLGHDHGHVHDGRHVHASHSAGVTTAFAPLCDRLDRVDVERQLTHAMADFAVSLLRLKGVVALAPDGDLWVVQAMPGEGVTLSPLPPRPGATPALGLTIIAQETPATVIAAALVARLADAHSVLEPSS